MKISNKTSMLILGAIVFLIAAENVLLQYRFMDAIREFMHKHVTSSAITVNNWTWFILQFPAALAAITLIAIALLPKIREELLFNFNFCSNSAEPITVNKNQFIIKVDTLPAGTAVLTILATTDKGVEQVGIVTGDQVLGDLSQLVPKPCPPAVNPPIVNPPAVNSATP